MKTSIVVLVGAMQMALSCLALAQTAPPPLHAAPAEYRSAFEDYNAYEDVAVGDWLAANASVSKKPSGTTDEAKAEKPGSAPTETDHKGHHGVQK